MRCMYCNNELPDGRVLSVCDSCGIKVWGEKMFYAIVSNMEDAKDKGDL